jgi:hypothetical protein
MADENPAETTAPVIPAPAAATPDPRDQAIRTAVADLERLASEAVGRGDQAMVERLRAVALPLANARPKA